METVWLCLHFVVLHLVFICYSLDGDGVKEENMHFLTKKYFMMTQKRCFYCIVGASKTNETRLRKANIQVLVITKVCYKQIVR